MIKRVGRAPKNIPAGSFDPKMPGRFAASPEALETIQRIKDRHGLTVNIVPNEESAPSFAAGYFNYEGPGGSFDPETRTIYLGKNPSLFTLEHELGHATDPYLPRSWEFEKALTNQLNDKFNRGELNTPAERLQTLMLGVPRRRLDVELTAQRYALDRMKEKGLEDDETRSDLTTYPLQYIDQGIRGSQVSEVFHDGNFIPDSVAPQVGEVFIRPYSALYPGPFETSFMPNANTVVDFGDSVVNELLELALDRNYQETAQREYDRAKAYATRRMGY